VRLKNIYFDFDKTTLKNENATLSQGRSEAVVDYVISQGVDAYRLSAHGYGESKPLDTNDSEYGRANNRRVEFTVMKK
jgi:outer membrane protein OmpA-like peptidoglycan-associated protein